MRRPQRFCGAWDPKRNRFGKRTPNPSASVRNRTWMFPGGREDRFTAYVCPEDIKRERASCSVGHSMPEANDPQSIFPRSAPCVAPPDACLVDQAHHEAAHSRRGSTSGRPSPAIPKPRRVLKRGSKRHPLTQKAKQICHVSGTVDGESKSKLVLKSGTSVGFYRRAIQAHLHGACEEHCCILWTWLLGVAFGVRPAFARMQR